MKKIGIVGGTAWLSTVDYYATICELSERHHASRDSRARRRLRRCRLNLLI
jgi:aspartate/glutamate racemase